MRAERCRIGAGESAEVAGNEEGRDRQPESKGQQGQEFDGRNACAGARQFHAAFETNREQQQRADKIVNGGRQA